MAIAINQEWLNENSGRNYPFYENARLNPVDSYGNWITDIRLPNRLIVDMVFTLPGTGELSLYLAQFAKVGNLATFTFKDTAGVTVAALAVDIAQHVKNQAYNITGAGSYLDARGRMVIGDLAGLDEDIPEGLYNFLEADAAFEPSVIRPDIRGVRTLQIDQEGTLSEYITGHVKLVEGTNIQLTYLPAYNAIRIDAVAGAGLNQECDCDALAADTCITQLNGIAIEDMEIIGDGCVNVSVSGNTIVISDSCSEPCCGCPELEFLTENLKVLDATVSNLEGYATELASKIQQFVNSFVLTVQGQ